MTEHWKKYTDEIGDDDDEIIYTNKDNTLYLFINKKSDYVYTITNDRWYFIDDCWSVVGIGNTYKQAKENYIEDCNRYIKRCQINIESIYNMRDCEK